LYLWSLVMTLIEYAGCTQLLVSLGRIYRLESKYGVPRNSSRSTWFDYFAFWYAMNVVRG
jgi:hypothetical protein